MKNKVVACCVVTELCTHPWNVKPRLSAPRTCYCCGERVCEACSLLILDAGFSHRIVRACLNCMADDPDRFGFEDSDGARNFWQLQKRLFFDKNARIAQLD